MNKKDQERAELHKSIWQIELIGNDIKKRGLIRDGIHLPYNPNNVDIAKRFRKQMTPAEQKLRDKYLSKNKYKFYRQRPIDHFIVDFYCSKFDLVIEVDGGIHYKQKEYDQMRTEFLNLYGLNVLRFSNKEVLENFDNVCKKIEKYISEYLVSSKKLSPTRGDTALAGEGLKQRTGGIVNLINFIDEGGTDTNYKLLRGVDYNKDQSYFLSGLNQYQLRKALFPIGGMKKEEVRELAKKIGLPNADRKDSQGLCFIGKVPMKDFLKKRLPIKKGDVVLLDGTKVGEHEGAYFFTIGQSRGLDINKKAYVVRIDVKKNLVFVSYEKFEPELVSKEIKVSNWHWIGQKYELPLECSTKIRYRQEPQEATLLESKVKSGKLKVVYEKEQWGIASGQTLTAYIGDECIGSGIIEGV